jgi:hypothetical protein
MFFIHHCVMSNEHDIYRDCKESGVILAIDNLPSVFGNDTLGQPEAEDGIPPVAGAIWHVECQLLSVQRVIIA